MRKVELMRLRLNEMIATQGLHETLAAISDLVAQQSQGNREEWREVEIALEQAIEASLVLINTRHEKQEQFWRE